MVGEVELAQIRRIHKTRARVAAAQNLGDGHCAAQLRAKASALASAPSTSVIVFACKLNNMLALFRHCSPQ